MLIKLIFHNSCSLVFIPPVSPLQSTCSSVQFLPLHHAFSYTLFVPTYHTHSLYPKQSLLSLRTSDMLDLSLFCQCCAWFTLSLMFALVLHTEEPRFQVLNLLEHNLLLSTPYSLLPVLILVPNYVSRAIPNCFLLS